MIRLHQFPNAPGLPVSASPYCIKVELYLRLTGRAYEVVIAPNPRASPSGEVPWVTWPDGSTTADSGTILARLEQEGPALDEGLPDDERRRGAALDARVDAPIYFSSLYACFGDPVGWERQKGYISSALPWALRLFVPALIRKSQVAKCAKHGFSGVSSYEQGATAIREVAEYLGDKAFLSGDEPRVVDCGVWSQLVIAMYTHQPTPHREAARGDERLVAYTRRVAERGAFELPSFR